MLALGYDRNQEKELRDFYAAFADKAIKLNERLSMKAFNYNMKVTLE
jgi:hypothetical protein